jgi:hypothetical protein
VGVGEKRVVLLLGDVYVTERRSVHDRSLSEQEMKTCVKIPKITKSVSCKLQSILWDFSGRGQYGVFGLVVGLGQ